MLNVVPLKEEHLEDAAALVSNRYIKLYEQIPDLPHQYREVSILLPLLENILQTNPPGVAAIREGKLVGFLTGWQMPSFRGKKSTYSPEWANGADLEESAFIYEERCTAT
jgi:hypothetical protein